MVLRRKLSSHLGAEHYRVARELAGGPGVLGRRLLDHLGEVCEECRRFWSQLGRLRSVLRGRLDELRVDEEEGARDPWEVSVTPGDLEAQASEVAEMRRRRRRSWEQKSELLRTPSDERVAIIENARTRFRSRLLAEELLAEGRDVMATDPHRAVEIFRLLPHVLRRADLHSGPQWAWSYLVQARAWEANSLRIAGQLRQAATLFVALHDDLAERPTDDVRSRALLASLEASLSIEELRFDEASVLLGTAARLYEIAGARRGQAKVEIKQANLLSRQGEAANALRRYESATANLNESRDADLLLTTVSGRIKVLCDLDRASEAQALLEENVDLFETGAEVYGGAYYRALDGRIRLALEEYSAAEESFDAAVEAFLALDRAYDATLAALDLARTYLLAGKLRELRQLVPPILTRLKAHGVSKKTGEVLALLGQSIQRDGLTLAFLSELRQALRSRR